MNRTHAKAAYWSTSSFGSPPDPSPTDLASLGEHMKLCDGLRGRLFRLHSAGDRLHSFVAPRVITMLVLFSFAGVFAHLVS